MFTLEFIGYEESKENEGPGPNPKHHSNTGKILGFLDGLGLQLHTIVNSYSVEGLYYKLHEGGPSSVC